MSGKETGNKRNAGLHEGHRQRMRARLKTDGAASLADHEALEVLLFYAFSQKNTNDLAHELLRTFVNLNGVLDASMEALKTVDGIGDSSAMLIKIVADMVRRYKQGEMSKPSQVIRSSEAAGAILLPKFINCRSEVLYMLCLDAAMRVIDCRQISQGSTTFVSVNFRQIVHTALGLNASYVILAHNHTAGIALPSPEDRAVTQRIKELLAEVDVTLADHLVVAEDDFVSLADSGELSGY